MTYPIVVDAGGKPVVVKVEASSESIAQKVARWLVEHAARLQAKEKENAKER